MNWKLDEVNLKRAINSTPEIQWKFSWPPTSSATDGSRNMPSHANN